MTFEKMGKTADALESYRNAYKLNPNYDNAYAAYGLLLYRQGSKTEAENFLNDQSSKNPKLLFAGTEAGLRRRDDASSDRGLFRRASARARTAISQCLGDRSHAHSANRALDRR